MVIGATQVAGTMRIAIVGGGATGALAALHLARALPDCQTEIIIIEPAQTVGRGLAYATDDPRHLLNVRVANMSAFADQPDHLLEWLRREGPVHGLASPTPFCFIPRGTYGAYIADLAQQSLASGAVRHVRDRCLDLTEDADAVTLRLSSGEAVRAEWVVLATGNDAKPVLSGIPAVQPWTEATLTGLPSDAPVLIVGSGLTMVDMVLSLDRRGHLGKITALSSHGLLSLPHRPVKPFPIAAGKVPFGAELSALTAWLCGLARATTSQGGDWRAAIDALRPHTQGLWRSMSLVQRRRFLRHARAYWDVHRHRMAPEVEKQIARLRAAGRLEIVAGRIVRARQVETGIDAEIARRGGGREIRKFARLIDCTGLADDPRRSENPLIRNLLARGAARADPLGIGLHVDEDYALIDAASQRSRRVRAVGPLARAAFWECIAIPDIRVQCRDLTERIAASASMNAPAGYAPQRAVGT
jgi:uncharacterized NAD(P)/FAD-binding protein YdhS